MAHAFYKERIVHMLECLKDKVSQRCLRWATEAKKNKNNFTKVDISREFYQLFCENIVYILFGEDICDQI